jgi:CHAD domain-containing protein
VSETLAAPSATLELDLPPDFAARLPRHAAIARRRSGRGRGAPLALVWSDSADGRLAAHGFAMEAGGRALPRPIRLWPETDDPAPPGAPPAEADPAAAAKRLAEAPLAAYGAFAGRQASLPLGALRGTLWTGQLRGVAAVAPVARLALEGPAPEVFALARELAAEAAVLPPRAGLAEATRALVAGTGPHPRRSGPPDVTRAATVGEALPVLASHLAEALLFHAPEARPDAPAVAVHQMRVAARRFRAGLRVFRRAADGPAARRLSREAGDLARALGPARDWDVFLAGLGADLAAAAGEERRLAGLLQAAEAARLEAYAGLRAALGGAGFRLLVLDLAEAARLGVPAEGEGEATPLRAHARDTLRRLWRRLAEDGAAIGELDDAALHALRLDAKRLRYATELFGPLWPGKSARRFARRLAELQEVLGLANDVVVARALVAQLMSRDAGRAWAVGLAEGWALARARRARRAASDAWAAVERAERFWESG